MTPLRLTTRPWPRRVPRALRPVAACAVGGGGMVSVKHVLTLIVFGVYTTKCEPELGAGASGKERARWKLGARGKTEWWCPWGAGGMAHDRHWWHATGWRPGRGQATGWGHR